MRRAFVLACVGLGLGLAVAIAASPSDAVAAPVPGSAAAEEVRAEVMVLHAMKKAGEGSVDPKIGAMPQLGKPPFDAYNTFKLLDRKDVTLKKGASTVYPLVNGHKLDLVLLEKTTEKPPRFRIGASIAPPKGEAFLKKIEVSAPVNEPFFVAGQSHAGGILVVGITVR